MRCCAGGGREGGRSSGSPRRGRLRTAAGLLTLFAGTQAPRAPRSPGQLLHPLKRVVERAMELLCGDASRAVHHIYD